MDTLKLKEKDIKIAADLIKKGEIVAFPTDTVYGLGANALEERAVDKIFQAKNRPANRPLSVLIANKSDLNQYAVNVPVEAEKLVEEFWPGPLTIILQKSDCFAPSVTMGKNTVGLRMPNNHLALELIKASQVPIAAPSANSSGRPSPTQAKHVLDDLNDKISAVLDGGETAYGLESTVLDLSDPTNPIILRPGEISKEALEEIIQKNIDVLEDNTAKHYKPTVPVYGVYSSWEKAIFQMKKCNEKIGILANDDIINKYKNQVEASFSLGKKNDINAAKRHFYNGLRTLETLDTTIILAETFNIEEDTETYMNRLEKAADGKII